jgi:hypothetical protein
MAWSSTDIVVLVVFGAIAAFGIAFTPRHHSPWGEWIARMGLLGVGGWLCWLFFRPGGMRVNEVYELFHRFFSK